VRDLNVQDLENLEVGAGILGTGGGGDPYIGKLLAREQLLRGKKITLVDPKEVDSESEILPVAMMGAPVIMIEKVPGGKEVVKSLEYFEKNLKESIDFITPIEIGGVNSTVPLAVAGMTGKPVVDGDGEGRAFPELQMVTFHLGDIQASPVAMFDERGNNNIVMATDNVWAERIARSVTVRFGGSAYVALYHMKGIDYKKWAVLNTITKCIDIGDAIMDAKRSGRNVFDALLDETGGVMIFSGKIIEVKREVERGFARGSTVIEGSGEFRNKHMRIDFQNENLMASIDGEIITSVPDLITILDSETSVAITTEHLKYGFRVNVMVMKCDERWRTAKGLETVGPRYFGYDIEYRPMEELI
jgi:DUF917 family protein